MIRRLDRLIYLALYAPLRRPRRCLTRARRRALVTYGFPPEAGAR